MKNSVTIAVVVLVLCAIAACGESARNGLTGPSDPSSGLAASPEGDARSLNGSAEVQQMPGVVYRNTIAARLNAAGEASGTLTVNIIDLSGFGVADGKATIVGRIDCLDFAGDSVWFGGEAISSSRPDLLNPPEVAQTIGQVKIANGQTYLHSGPTIFYTAPGTTCKDRPSLPIAPVTNGGFHIR